MPVAVLLLSLITGCHAYLILCAGPMQENVIRQGIRVHQGSVANGVRLDPNCTVQKLLLLPWVACLRSTLMSSKHS